jgi:hypothetical protein
MPFLLPALAFAPFLGVFVSFSSASTSLSSSSPPAHPRVLLYTDFSPKKKNSAVAPWWVTDGDTWQDIWDREVRERLRQVCQSSGFTFLGASPPPEMWPCVRQCVEDAPALVLPTPAQQTGPS